MSKFYYIFLIMVLLIVTLCFDQHISVVGAENITGEIKSGSGILYEKGIAGTKDQHDARIKRETWAESSRGVYTKSSTHLYFQDLYFDLGQIVSEEATFDNSGRPIKASQMIQDALSPAILQQRLLSNIEYNQNNKPISYKEEIFISANDYLSDTIVRFFSTSDIYKIQYSDSGKPVTILGNTEIVISDNEGNALLNIMGSFTKRAKYDLSGKIIGYYRYGIDNIVVADGAGEIIVTAPPSATKAQDQDEYRVGIVNIKDEQRLHDILNNQTFINQLLAKFGLAQLFYKAFHAEKFYEALSYLQIENTPEEIMSLQNITSAFKGLIRERQQAYALFQNDVDMYYEELAEVLFENVNLWWDRGVSPQEHYAGSDKILSKSEYRKIVDDAVVCLTSRADTLGATTTMPQQILSLEQHLRTQMIMNSKLNYIKNLRNAVSTLDKQLSIEAGKLDRPVLIHEKDTIEALIALPPKDSHSSKLSKNH